MTPGTKEKNYFYKKAPPTPPPAAANSSHPGYLIEEERDSEPEQVLSSVDWSVSSSPCKNKRF